ncbi:MAG TPA: aldo/keto reductase [Pricia sp.]|nr:aldo/keto reductase [Pricia sp.]
MRNNRRQMLRSLSLGSIGLVALPKFFGFTQTEKNTETGKSMMARNIPSSGEELPVVGLGTWQTFDAGTSQEKLKTLEQVLVEMQKLGGKVIDSSPMYGSSEAVVGRLTDSLENSDYFYATKVWTSGKQAGIDQMNTSFEKMRRHTMDLMQIHNLVDWQTHVKTLKTWKEEGKIRYWGITHYVDSAHETLEKIIRQEKPDFAQFNYSIRSRHAEDSLFETCQEHGTATIINQPFESGSLFRKVKDKALPDWTSDYDIKSWGQYFLKFILANEAVTCVIPGTSKPEHAIDNMMAGYGALPDASGQDKMAAYLTSI